MKSQILKPELKDVSILMQTILKSMPISDHQKIPEM